MGWGFHAESCQKFTSLVVCEHGMRSSYWRLAPVTCGLVVPGTRPYTWRILHAQWRVLHIVALSKHLNKYMYNAKAYSATSATSPPASTTIKRRDPTEHDVQIDILLRHLSLRSPPSPAYLPEMTTRNPSFGFPHLGRSSTRAPARKNSVLQRQHPNRDPLVKEESNAKTQTWKK
jgi:hypothetical protein